MVHQRSLRVPWLVLLCGFPLVSCGQRAAVSEFKYDSATNVALDGTVEQGVVVTDSDADDVVRGEVIEQLRYAIGQLNGEGGGIDLAHAAIELVSKSDLGTGRFRIAYKAKALVSWPRGSRLAGRYDLVLPARGDAEGRRQFTQNFAIMTNRQTCLAADAHDVDSGSFWYYYRPYGRRCPVMNAGSGDVAHVALALAVSGQNTTAKAPEYGKVWEDGKLVVTAVFSKYEAGATSANDAGIAGFRSAFDALVQRFGAPLTSNLPRGEEPSAVNSELRITFSSPKGPVDVAMFLVDSVVGVGADFQAKFAERTLESDLISYDGHSGLGANIRALTRLGAFKAGQYQIYLLNGCDSFSYTDDAVKAAHQAVNPDAGPDKFVDLITNARPAEFGAMPAATMALVNALANPGPTYRQILAQFDGSQRAGVSGEQDNNWPNPF